MKKDILIFGAGGFAREVAWLIEEINSFNNKWNLIGFVDKLNKENNKLINGYPVFNSLDKFNKIKDLYSVCAIGDTHLKKKIILNEINKNNIKLATLIHPLVRLSKYSNIGEGTIICNGTNITTNIKIGNNVIINLNCTVGHDVIIENYVTIAPGCNISGGVHIEEGANIGTNSSIIQLNNIGKWSMIGAGAVVTKNISDNCVAIGVPAKPIKICK